MTDPTMESTTDPATDSVSHHTANTAADTGMVANGRGHSASRGRGPHDLGGLLRARIRDIPDYPQAGIVFKDITPLLADHVAFAGVVDAVVNHHGRGTVDLIRQAGGVVVGCSVLLELAILGARTRLTDLDVHALLQV